MTSKRPHHVVGRVLENVAVVGWMRVLDLIYLDRRLLVVGSVRGVIGGFNFREPLHADGVDLGDPVLEDGPFNLTIYLAIPKSGFRVTSCPFGRVLANFERFLQA
jgi:hypothetical protein